jgi:hypothetical protein
MPVYLNGGPGGGRNSLYGYNYLLGCSECKHVITLENYFDSSDKLEKVDPIFLGHLFKAHKSAQQLHYTLPEHLVHSRPRSFESHRPEGYEFAIWWDGCPLLATKEEKM